MPIKLNLDRVMSERQISLTELADRIGITLANLSVLKTNKARAIRFTTLEALCRELKCQPGDLLEKPLIRVPPALRAPPQDPDRVDGDVGLPRRRLRRKSEPDRDVDQAETDGAVPDRPHEDNELYLDRCAPPVSFRPANANDLVSVA